MLFNLTELLKTLPADCSAIESPSAAVASLHWTNEPRKWCNFVSGARWSVLRSGGHQGFSTLLRSWGRL